MINHPEYIGGVAGPSDAFIQEIPLQAYGNNLEIDADTLRAALHDLPPGSKLYIRQLPVMTILSQNGLPPPQEIEFGSGEFVYQPEIRRLVGRNTEQYLNPVPGTDLQKYALQLDEPVSLYLPGVPKAKQRAAVNSRIDRLQCILDDLVPGAGDTRTGVLETVPYLGHALLSEWPH